MANGVYAPDGSWRGTTSVTGNGRSAPDGALRLSVSDSKWGYTAPDGSIYIEVVASGTTGNGLYNGRGNFRIVQAEIINGNSLYAPNGAIRMTGVANVAPAIAFNNAGIWTVVGTGASSTVNSFSGTGIVGALATVPPLVIGRSYYYSITYTITGGGTLQLVNGTATTPVINSSAANGTMTGTFTAVDTNFRLRLTTAGTVTVSNLVII